MPKWTIFLASPSGTQVPLSPSNRCKDATQCQILKTGRIQKSLSLMTFAVCSDFIYSNHLTIPLSHHPKCIQVAVPFPMCINASCPRQALPASLTACFVCAFKKKKDMVAALTVFYWMQWVCVFKCVAASRLKKCLLLPAALESAWASIKSIVAAGAMLLGVAARIRGSASCLVYALYLFLAPRSLSLSLPHPFMHSHTFTPIVTAAHITVTQKESH